jgi:exodeoxyribonuclease-3
VFTVITANVNGVRAALRRGGLQWLAAAGADVLCLQEVRASTEHLTLALAEGGLGGWHVAAAPAERAGHAGVAVLTRDPPAAVRTELGGAFGDQGRWIEVDLALPGGPLTVISAYVHAGEADTPRQLEKFAFLDAMTDRMAALGERAGAGAGAGEALVTGDLNVAHRKQDLKNWQGNVGKAGFLEAEQAYFDRWFDNGWNDLGRRHSGDGPGPYTWWSWRGKAFDNDSGWRIDYLLATAGLAARSVKVEVGRAPSYAERWSDHAPVTAWFV